MSTIGHSGAGRATFGAVLVALALAVPAGTMQAQESAEIQRALTEAYAKYKDLQEGKNADYIPALAKVDPKLFGIALVTADGRVFTIGDSTTEVSIGNRSAEEPPT